MDPEMVKNLGASLMVPSVQELAKHSITKVPEQYVRPNQDPPVVSNTIPLPQVPVIDLKKLLCEDSTELEKLDHACKEWGFFQMDPMNNMNHTGFMGLAFEYRDSCGAWVIKPGARGAVYTGPLLISKGTEAGTESCTHCIKTVEVPLPPIWLLLRALLDSGDVYHQPPLFQFPLSSASASSVPALPAPIVVVGGEDGGEDMAIEEDPEEEEEDPIEEDPEEEEEEEEEGVEYNPMDDDAVDPIADADVGEVSPDPSPIRDDHVGLPNGFH